MEGCFEDNLHTARGIAEHIHVDSVAHRAGQDGVRVESSLPVWSDRLGLIGKCDVVEFWSDGTVYPVEYKHGARRKWNNDDLQVMAQAICLEEMLGCVVVRAAVYHATSRRRREVVLTPALRSQVERCVREIRQMLVEGRLPAPVNDRRCVECSMRPICDPELAAQAEELRLHGERLFRIDD
jgi:CRISPR-associated exonuclease Cas4